MRIEWTIQNEVTDADGFFLQGKEAEEAERAWLAAQGAPDTDTMAFVGVEVVDRDEAFATADVSDALGAWLQREVLPEPM